MKTKQTNHVHHESQRLLFHLYRTMKSNPNWNRCMRLRISNRKRFKLPIILYRWYNIFGVIRLEFWILDCGKWRQIKINKNNCNKYLFDWPVGFSFFSYFHSLQWILNWLIWSVCDWFHLKRWENEKKSFNKK